MVEKKTVKPTPTGLSRSQIEELAVLFANGTNFIPCETDIREYIQKIGGTIVYDTNNTKLDSNGGSIDVDGPTNFTITLSKDTSPKRDIFTLAHELGHFVLHSRLGQIPIRAHRSGDLTLLEKEANSFAASFLMPKELFSKEFAKLNGNISELASKFNVSIMAATWRCKNLGLI